MRDFVPKRASLDRHIVGDTRQLIDLVAVGSGDIDDNRRRNPFGLRQHDTFNLPRCLVRDDLCHLSTEPKNSARLFRRSHQIMRGKRRVGDVPARAKKHGSRQRRTVGFSKRRIIGQSGRREGLRRQPRHSIKQLRRVQIVVGTVKRVHQLLAALQKPVIRRLHHHAAAVHVPRMTALIVGTKIVGPIFPIEMRFVGNGTTVQRRIVRTDNRARSSRRAMSGLSPFIDYQNFSAIARKSERDGGSNDACANNHRIKFSHSEFLPSVWPLRGVCLCGLVFGQGHRRLVPAA